MGPGIAIWHCNNARPRFLPHSRSLEQELDFERLLRKFDATFRDAIKDAALIGRMRYCKTQLMPSEKANARAPAFLTCGVRDRNALIPSYGALALLRPVGLQDHSSTCVVECPMACHWHAISRTGARFSSDPRQNKTPAVAGVVVWCPGPESNRYDLLKVDGF